MDLDYYRSLDCDALLLRAREDGINPAMAVAIAEEMERMIDGGREPFGGRYVFNHRSDT